MDKKKVILNKGEYVFCSIIDINQISINNIISSFYNSEDIYMSNNWFEIATNQLIIKILIGLILFLPVYGVLLSYLKKKILINKK